MRALLGILLRQMLLRLLVLSWLPPGPWERQPQGACPSPAQPEPLGALLRVRALELHLELIGQGWGMRALSWLAVPLNTSHAVRKVHAVLDGARQSLQHGHPQQSWGELYRFCRVSRSPLRWLNAEMTELAGRLLHFRLPIPFDREVRASSWPWYGNGGVGDAAMTEVSFLIQETYATRRGYDSLLPNLVDLPQKYHEPRPSVPPVYQRCPARERTPVALQIVPTWMASKANRRKWPCPRIDTMTLLAPCCGRLRPQWTR